MCRSSPTFPSSWKTSSPELGGFPGSLLFRTTPCHRFGYAKSCLGALLSWRDMAPALGLAMKRLLKASVPCPRPLQSLTPTLPHQLQAFLKSIFTPGGGEGKVMLAPKTFYKEQDATASACKSSGGDRGWGDTWDSSRTWAPPPG